MPCADPLQRLQDRLGYQFRDTRHLHLTPSWDLSSQITCIMSRNKSVRAN